MKIKDISQQLHFIKQCRRWGLTLWECPSFLFIIMGIVTVLVMLGTYMIASQYEDSDVVVISVSVVTILILTIGSAIVKGTEKIARANMMKSEFISIASHELKSPLTGIKWSLNLLFNDKVNSDASKQLEYLKSIKENNDRMIKLVNDLLNISRIEQGRIKMRPEIISLEEIVESLIKEFTPFIQSHNITISFDKEANLPKVKADPQRIRSVVQNLLDNAVKYIKEKGKIEIILKKEKSYLYCQIKDNGVGIPSYQQKKIFTKFFRADNVLSRQTRGTGLGLYIARAIIESSGGKIGFTSQEGKGSTFWFTLPVFQKAINK